MTIREYLISIGASQQELRSNVVSRMEKAMLFDVDLSKFQPDTVLQMIREASSGIRAAEVILPEAQRMTEQLRASVNAAQRERDDLKKQTFGLRDVKITNSETKDAVLAYAAVLNATKDIFGTEAMTGDVIVAAINAASYTAWRSIMGPKGADDAYMAKTRRGV